MTVARRLLVAAALGSGLGALARWALAIWLHQPEIAAFPWATLWANVAGSLIIGIVAALDGAKSNLLSLPTIRQFVMVGFCGGFTTFSIFSLEALSLTLVRAYGMAALYVGLSTIVWLLAVWAGFELGRRLPSMPGKAAR